MCDHLVAEHFTRLFVNQKVTGYFYVECSHNRTSNNREQRTVSNR